MGTRHTRLVSSANVVPLRRPMTGRDPHEPHRVATPLELFFDLVFVVAIASAAAEWHHGLSAAHYDTLIGFCTVFFAIWWAWMSYTWFASAYDTDDVAYRLLTFTIMTGSLLLAAGVPDLFDDGQSVLVVLGYSVMRVAMIAMWLRAARAHPERRRTAQLYACGIGLAQVYWIARLLITDERWLLPSFALGVALELAVPYVAETRGGITTFHPHHIAERYSLFSIIVMGEVLLSSAQAIQGALSEGTAGGTAGSGGHTAPYATGSAGGGSLELAVLVCGGLLLVFSLWWTYFKREHADLFAGRHVFVAGYGHVFVFMSIAAVGSALAAAVDVVQGEALASSRAVGLAMAIPVAVYALTLAGMHYVADRDVATIAPALAVGAVSVALALMGVGMGVTVLLLGLTSMAGVVWHVRTTNREALPIAP